MPSSSTSATTLAFQLSFLLYVPDIGRQRIERDARDVGVRFRVRIDPARGIADRGVRHAHAAVEPGSAAEAAEHRDGNRLGHGPASLLARMTEVEQDGTRLLQRLRLRNQLGRRTP